MVGRMQSLNWRDPMEIRYPLRQHRRSFGWYLAYHSSSPLLTVTGKVRNPTLQTTSTLQPPCALGPNALLLNNAYPRTISSEPPLSPGPLKHKGSPYAYSPFSPGPEYHPTATQTIQRVLIVTLKPKIRFDLHYRYVVTNFFPSSRPRSQ